MKSTKTPRLALVLLLALYLLPSCTKKTPPSEPFCLTGSASGCVSAETVAALKKFDLPEGFSLYIQIDSLCAEKEYYGRPSPIDSSIVIVASLSPRLIKAEVYGLGSNVLSSYRATEYFSTQHGYASGGSLEAAVTDMAAVCRSALEDARQKSNWLRDRFAGPITDSLSDLMQLVLYYIVPGDGFIGKTIRPIYALSYWAISTSGSVTFGLFLMVSLFAAIILLLFFGRIFGLKKGKQYFLLVIPALLLLWIMFLFVVYYSFRIGKPLQENLFAYENIYGFTDTTPLVTAYLSHSFHSTTLVLLLLTAIAYLVMKALKVQSEYKFSKSQGMTDEYLQKKGEDMAESFADDPLGPIKNTLLVLAVFIFVDRSIVIGFLFYFILKIIMFLANFNKPARFYANHTKAIIVSIVVAFCALLGTAYVHGRTVREQEQQKYFHHERVDSISYYLGINLARLLNKVGADSVEKIDTALLVSGMMDYISARTGSSSLEGESYNDLDIYKKRTFPKGMTKEQASYTIGKSYARTLFNWSVFPLLNFPLLSAGLGDCLLRRPARYSPEKLQEVLNHHVSDFRPKQNDYNTNNGALFLKRNSRNEDVVYKPSGLQCRIISPGNSRRAKPDSKVSVKYVGYTLGGDRFDFLANTRYIVLNRMTAGFREAVEQIGEGGKVIAWVPYALGRDDKGNAPAGIMPGEVIVYEINLLAILK